MHKIFQQKTRVKRKLTAEIAQNAQYIWTENESTEIINRTEIVQNAQDISTDKKSKEKINRTEMAQKAQDVSNWNIEQKMHKMFQIEI